MAAEKQRENSPFAHSAEGEFCYRSNTPMMAMPATISAIMA